MNRIEKFLLGVLVFFAISALANTWLLLEIPNKIKTNEAHAEVLK